MTFTSGHFEIRKWPKNYQNLLRTFIELEAHRHQWGLDRNKCSDGKLRTYVKFKTVYGRENYLSLMFLLNSELLQVILSSGET
jgi:hypothetical protein